MWKVKVKDTNPKGKITTINYIQFKLFPLLIKIIYIYNKIKVAYLYINSILISNSVICKENTILKYKPKSLV